jgi:hypothetical protein
MFGLPKYFPFDKISSEVISSIDFSQNQTIFRLGDSISISAECSMVLDQDILEEHPDVCRHAGRLLGLLHQKIESVTTENGKDLKFIFASGTILILRDDSEHYESYIVDVGDKKYVI